MVFMKSQMRYVLFCCMVLMNEATLQSSQTKTAANPIRKVVTMLQNMLKKVEEEGEAEKKL